MNWTAKFIALSLAVSDSQTGHIDLLCLILLLYLVLSLLVFFQPRNMIVVIELKEELYKRVINELFG